MGYKLRVPRRTYYALLLAAINAMIASYALLVIDDYLVIKALGVASFSLFILICLLQTGNLLFLARTFFLGAIGYFPLLIKVMLGDDALFSGYEPSTQGFDIVAIMYVTTSFALLSNQIGLTLAKPRRRQNGAHQIVPPRQGTTAANTGVNYWWIAGVTGVLLTVFSSYMFVRGYGRSILVGGYASEEQLGAGLPFGSVGVLGAMGIFSLFVAGIKGHVRYWKVICIAICVLFVVFAQLLLGPRQDAISVLFGLVILYGVTQRRDIPLKLRYLPLLAVGYIFIEVWGVARIGLAAGMPLGAIVTAAFTNIGAAEAIRFGTVSPIATTFANTVWLVQNEIIHPTWGKSYLEWLLRIPPEAMFPNRPRDYAWMFSDYGLSAGGGFFELAEVYMNFGVIGALVISGVISFLLAKTYYYAKKRQTVLSYFLLFSFLAIFLRGTWYQTFAFFRAFLVCIGFYFIYIGVVQTVRWGRGYLRSAKLYSPAATPADH